MEVITVIIMTIINTIIIIIVVTVKDIDFKKLKATMEAAKQAEDQIQKTGEMAYNQVASFNRMVMITGMMIIAMSVEIAFTA